MRNGKRWWNYSGRVAFSDGVIDKYEEQLVRKVADLLHVRHHDFIAAKHRADPAS